MCSRLAARLLCCAPSSERGVVQHWGNKSWQCSVRVAVGTVAAEARAVQRGSLCAHLVCVTCCSASADLGWQEGRRGSSN